jgi:hypothetical protein
MGTPAEQLHPYVRGQRVGYTWSARFTFEHPYSLENVVVRKLGSIVTGFTNPEWPISGAVLGSGEVEDRTTLVLGLDPSRSFGTPDTNRCEEIAAKVTDTLGWQRQPENLSEMRIILGRRIGYEGEEYSMEEVRGLMVAHGCGDLALTEADLFSLRYVDGLSEYHEPGIIVEGSASNLTGALRVAADMGQQRLVAEITGVETQVYSKPSEA